MRPKRFPFLTALVILIGVPACDNVRFEGVEMELRPPPAAPGLVEEESVAEVPEEAPLQPIELGPLLYLVERTEGATATILPVAELTDDGYRALPDPEEIPDFMERFELGRWDEGRELTLLGHGGRVGTFVAGGGTESDASTCRLRPRSSGSLEVSPEVADRRWFLARPEDWAPPSSDTTWVVRPAEPPQQPDGPDAAAAALNIAQRLIPTLGIPWPSSIPGIRQDLHGFGYPTVEGVRRAVTASHVFGGALGTGNPSPSAYGFFFIAIEDDDRYEPVITWYQRAEWGKAFPRFLGSHDVRTSAGPDAVLEVFGESDRWLAIVGPDDGEWGLLYQDACGQEPARGAIQSFP